MPSSRPWPNRPGAVERAIYRPGVPTVAVESILSTEERAVAAEIAAGRSIAEIATARDSSEEVVQRADSRIREKTNRALATLLESHVAQEAVDELDPDQRAALRELFVA